MLKFDKYELLNFCTFFRKRIFKMSNSEIKTVTDFFLVKKIVFFTVNSVVDLIAIMIYISVLTFC